MRAHGPKIVVVKIRAASGATRRFYVLWFCLMFRKEDDIGVATLGANKNTQGGNLEGNEGAMENLEARLTPRSITPTLITPIATTSIICHRPTGTPPRVTADDRMREEIMNLTFVYIYL